MRHNIAVSGTLIVPLRCNNIFNKDSMVPINPIIAPIILMILRCNKIYREKRQNKI
jgi:hypothetical protein